jgi:hypothetical protein
MKQLLLFSGVIFLFVCITSGTGADKIEVLYDSKPIGKEGIKLISGKSIQVINASGGKVYKVEAYVSMGKRPCFQKTYSNSEAARPIDVVAFMSPGCADADALILKINLSTYITIPIKK